jgi:drug/metabolite transporter (DMT)-like permease
VNGILNDLMTKNTTRAALFGLSFTAAGAILFASKGLFSKALYRDGIDYQTITALRALLALPMFAALGLWRGVSLRGASPATLGLAALAGVLCYGFGSQLDFRALELIDVSLERALLFTYPAFIVAWYAIVHRRLPRGSTLAAVGLTYLGILLVVGAFDAGLWQRNVAGSLLVLFCAATTASYFLLGERCIPQLGSSGFTIVAMTAAAVVVCTQFAITHPLSLLATITAGQWLLLGALAVLCMFLPTLLQAEGIRRVGAERGALAGTIGPPAAMALGAGLLDEHPTGWQILGTMVIVAGILVVARSRVAAAGTPDQR